MTRRPVIMTRQILLTTVILLLLGTLFQIIDIDLWFQDYLYDFPHKHWLIDRTNPVTKFIFYDGIKIAFIIFIMCIIGSLIFFRKSNLVNEYKTGLLIVVFSAILIPVFIGTLKATTNTPCPKNITHYNGTYPYVTFLGHYPATFHQSGTIKCFPAGHASGGFALLSLFFLFKKKKNRLIAVAISMTIGWSIGFYKILIGDHFLSHTIYSMVLAWLLILIIACITSTYTKPVYVLSESP